jgi:hypothetical protein
MEVSMGMLITFEGETLTVRPWVNETIERIGFDPRSAYVERFWLGVIGPSCTWLLRRVAAGFEAAPEGFDMVVGEMARAIGLGDRGGRNSPFLRTLNRLIQFDLARVCGPSELVIMRRIPPLTARQAARLSPALQEAHERWREERAEEPPNEYQRRRSRQLALSLLELGEEADEVERQLLRWQYHPALASEAAAWALSRHRHALAVAGGP